MVFKKKSLIPKKPNQLDPETQFWNEVNTQARELITTTFNHSLVEETYSDYLTDYQRETDELTNPSLIAEQLAYEYLLGLCESILQPLSQFSCHEPQYFVELISDE